MTSNDIDRRKSLKKELIEIDKKIDEKIGDINKLSEKKQYLMKELNILKKEEEMDFIEHVKLVASLNGV